MISHEVLLLVLGVLQLAVVGICTPLIRAVFAIRRNDLHHLEFDIRDIKTLLGQIAERQDRHLEWHAMQKKE